MKDRCAGRFSAHGQADERLSVSEQHAAAFERATRSRLASAEWVLTTWAGREAERPGRLVAAGSWIQRSLNDDLQDTALNIHGAGQMLRRDIARWQEDQPAYRRKAGEVLLGRPEDIVPTAIRFW